MDYEGFARLNFTEEELEELRCYATGDIGCVRHSPPPPAPVMALETVSAEELQRMDLPPVRFVVEGLLPHGLSLIASPPKYGKSWMVLDLCLHTARGEAFLGFETNACRCLYLALEDSLNRLKSRMDALLQDRDAPPDFDYSVASHTLDDGLSDELDTYIKEHPDTGLIVIDTLQRIRGATHGREGVYAADYREIGALKSFADAHNVAVLLVHHLRKMTDESDPFNRISGTNGIFGAVDTAIVLARANRGDESTVMHVTGRDVEMQELSLKFDKETRRWTNCGNVEALEATDLRAEYECSSIVSTVKRLLEQSPKGSWCGSLKDILEAGRVLAHTILADTPQGLSKKLTRLEPLFREYDGIEHEYVASSRKHRFYYAYAQSPAWTELSDAPTDILPL